MAGGSIGPNSINVPRHSSDPSGAGEGDMYFNTSENSVKIHNGSQWGAIYEEPFVAIGGTITTSGNYTVHTFNSSGTFQVTGGSSSIDYLIIAGGGGAGGYLSGTSSISAASFTVTVGGGGGGGGSRGGNSSFNSLTANGGGPGGGNSTKGSGVGVSGGSGGGNNYNQTGAGGAGTSGQGFEGGRGWTAATGGTSNRGGGGGGAAEIGNADGETWGGDGKTWVDGVQRAGGGGGGNPPSNGNGSNQGQGGGGYGAHGLNSNNHQPGATNKGGGGGGAYASTGAAGGSGGSGVVIIRYLTQENIKMAHYAKVEDGIVVNVIVAEAEFFEDFVDTSPGLWIQTSYNTRGGVHYDPETGAPSADQSKALRKNYAIIGSAYDETRDAFMRPQPHASWILNESTCDWDPPIDYPDADSDTRYLWNEDTKSWDLQ